MTKVFDQFHFSLIERDQAHLFEPKASREEWLRRKFNDRFSFRHHGTQFHWVPQKHSDKFIVGVVERQRSQSQRTPPDMGAKEIEGIFWTGALVIVDPLDRPGGQRVAFEDLSNVGQPAAILKSMVAAINEDDAHQYALHFKPLFRGDSFWRFAEKHGNHLEYVSFRFTVPNMLFGAGGGVKSGLRRIGEDTKAQEIEMRIESDDGIRADSESVREGVAYGEEGNARVTAKSLDGDYWSSTRRKLTVRMKKAVDFASSTAQNIEDWLSKALSNDTSSGDDQSDGGDSESDFD